MKPFTYTPLNQPIRFRDRVDVIGAAGETWQVVAVGALLVVALFMTGIILTSGAGLIPILMVVTMAGITLAMLWPVWKALGQFVQMQRFSLANSLDLIRGTPSDEYRGMIFKRGRNQRIDGFLRQTTMQQGLYEFGNYEYTEGSGKNSHTYRYGVVYIKLPRHLPHIVLDARANNNLFGTNLPESFRSNEKLSLEGDFDKYFTLYAPVEYKTDALYVFTPDVMQALIETATQFDCEVIDNDLFLYSKPFNLAHQSIYEEIISMSTLISQEVAKQATNYSDSAVGNRALDVVAAPGQRLKTRIRPATVIIPAIFILYELMRVIHFFN